MTGRRTTQTTAWKRMQCTAWKGSNRRRFDWTWLPQGTSA